MRYLVGLGLALLLTGCAAWGTHRHPERDAGANGNGDGAVGADAGDAAACAVASDEAVARPVDVIVAIDQSASMGEEIQGVIDNLSTHLVDILAASNIDYRVIFVAGVSGLPTGPRYFTSAAAVNSSDALTLLLWTYDGYYKAPNTCTKTAQPALRWSDQVRLDGFKVFIVVSDDDPSSFDCASAAAACTADCAGCAADCAGWCPMFQCPTYADQPAAWGGGTFPEELYALAPSGMFGRPEAPKWVMHAIVPVTAQLGPSAPITPLATVCDANGNTGETSGVEYQKLAVLTGGLRFPSCDTDYSPVFQAIAATIVPLACAYALESTDLGPVDPTKVNVTFDPGDGSPVETILRDDNAPCESGADGWQYTDDGSTIRLCGPACDLVQDRPSGRVTITVGCDTQIRPPT